MLDTPLTEDYKGDVKNTVQLYNIPYISRLKVFAGQI